MTTIMPSTVECFRCGSKNRCDVMMSTITIDPPDLDGRPGKMYRNSMFTWVQRCHHCGYCASDLAKGCPSADGVINSEEYRAQLDDPCYPHLANSFICKALIDRESHKYAESGWAFLMAAWTCDDETKPSQAKTCREKAVNLFRKAEENGQPISKEKDSEALILVDVLRRSGQSEEARKLFTERRSGITDNHIASLLDYEVVLLDMGDVTVHTIEDAHRMEM